MSASEKAEFNGLRGFLWPVHRSELKKLIPMLLIFFLITFSYNILRTLKDTLVVTAKESGAEVIPFIKVWMMFPGSILLTILFTRLSNWFSKETVIYLMLALFLGYFTLFGFVLFPARDSIHFHDLADHLQQILPSGFKGFIAMLRNWTLTSFYVMSELWGNIVLFVLIWGFANRTTRLSEAKRFYALFGFGGNLSGIFAGQASIYVTKIAYFPQIGFGQNGWEQATMILIGSVILSGLLAMVIFRWMTTRVLTDPRYYTSDEGGTGSKVKEKLSFRESIYYLFRSRYMIYLALIVLAYNIVINLIEVVWKHQLRELYPDPIEYHRYFNQVSTIIGILATVSALCVSGQSIRKFGWTFTAMLTPAIMLVTSVLFFLLFFFGPSFEPYIHLFFGMTPLAMIVFVGSVQNILSRAAKYTVFDATKEMAFIPLAPEFKVKGKAAIDGVCNRMGKSGGSFIHQTLLLIFTTLSCSAPWVALCLFLIVGAWVSVVLRLGHEFNMLTEHKSQPAVSPAHLEESQLLAKV